MAWSDARAGSASDIYGTRLGSRISSSANSQLAPAVASSGQDSLVVWQDDRGGAYDIYGVRVRADGTVLDPTGIAISTAANNQSSPVATYDGQRYFVAWQDQRNGNADMYGARVSTAGQVRDPAGIAISVRAGSQNRPAIATSGQRHLVVWYDDRANFSPDIYGARVAERPMRALRTRALSIPAFRTRARRTQGQRTRENRTRVSPTRASLIL